MRLSSNTRFTLLMLLLLGLLTTYAGCGGRDLLGDVKNLLGDLFGPKTPRMEYRRLAEKENLVAERDLALWDTAYHIAKTSPLTVNLPHRELLHLDERLILSAQAMRMTVEPGRRLSIRFDTEELFWFGELYAIRNGKPAKRPLEVLDAKLGNMVFENNQRGAVELLFVLQSGPLTSLKCELQMTTKPVISFPVMGKDERAIRSKWGVPRDGGRRRHEGNDIFAPKGTNLLAVVSGEVTRLTETGIGGKTVWLYDRKRNLRYYYAHLDRQLVRKGDYVERGDVVGTVGNTGNARTTPPHLHFGIYAGGAIDPFPFLRDADAVPPSSPLHPRAAAQLMNVPKSGNHYLRFTPERDGAKIRQLENGEEVTALGVTGRFWRVKTGRGEIGYANFD